MKRLLLTAILLTLPALGAHAQPPGSAGVLPPAATAGGPTPLFPVPGPGPASPGAAGPPGNPYDAFGSYLQGGAAVIQAQGGFLLSTQQAALLREQVRQTRLVTRRLTLEQNLQERLQTPTLQDEQERAQVQELRRSANNPTFTEILSAKPLNDLFDHARRVQNLGARGRLVPLDGEMLKKIHVTSGSGGNFGLLGDDGRLNWPLVLQAADFEPERKQLDRLALAAVKQVRGNGSVETGTLADLFGSVGKLYRQLDNEVSGLTPSQYLEARRFLNQLKDALTVLRQPNAGKYANGQYAARGETVPELVRYMSRQGLRFAPAVEGDETAYVALHHALVAYATSFQAEIGRQTSAAAGTR